MSIIVGGYLCVAVYEIVTEDSWRPNGRPQIAMTTNATDDTGQRTTDGAGSTRYAELNIDDEFVIYDRQNHQAWIQSKTAVEADDMR